MELSSCEISVLIISTVATLTTCYMWYKYLQELHRNMEKKVYIMWDYHHSHQHFAIVLMIVMLSIFMYVNTFVNLTSESFAEHLVYNVLVIFFLIPHLQSED